MLPNPTRLFATVVLAIAVALPGAPAHGQAPVGVPDQDPEDEAISRNGPAGVEAEALRAARAAQARFEIRRVRWLPRGMSRGSGPCDETVGRFCSWYGEGDWVPVPEAPEIHALRAALRSELDSLQRVAPGDDWILGQRVWYRAEGGDWDEALEVALACAPPHEAWWCAALSGLALHGLGRTEEAERAFDRALHGMDLERAWRWRVPRQAVDRDGRRLLDALRDAPPDSVQGVLDRLWALADPLHLVPGNDRKTAHFARWTVATLRQGARTPYGLRWANDLEELVVRNGWELGWEREIDPRSTGPDVVIGRNHPEGRDFMPSGSVLAAPYVSEGADHVASRTRPRSLHAPVYAPVILPMDVQVAIFPRGPAFVLVAAHEVPADTTRRAREGRPRPWMDVGEGSDRVGGEADVGGLYLIEAATGGRAASARTQGTTGVSWVEAEAGRYLMSVEAWSPSRRIAGRHREGFEHRATPEDIPALSDLLLVRPRTGRPAEPLAADRHEGPSDEDLLDAAPRALPRAAIGVGVPVGLYFELSGLGFRAETLTFELSVQRSDRSLLQRLGGLLGRSGQDRTLAVSWREPAPDRPGLMAREVELTLPEVAPGRYEIRLVVRGQGRDPVTRSRLLEVTRGGGEDGTPPR